MVEVDSHADPKYLVSTVSDWVGITVNPVNDRPVTWGGEWDVDSAYDAFYGGNEWVYPENHGEDKTTFDNTVCIDDCYYTEDFGLEGFYVEISPRELKFGGRDIEGDDLEVVIRSVDCKAPGVAEERKATWELMNATGHFPVSIEDLPGMTMGQLLVRGMNEGYKLVSMLAFAPARDDWNVKSDETHENDESGEESEYYCRLTYAVVDSEGKASDDDGEPKTITIQVRQKNDQPTDSVLQDPSQSSTLVGYEDTDLYIKFDASDVENDDFVFTIESCDDSRGTYYLPHPSQHKYINTNGELEVTPNNENQLFGAPVRCNQTSTLGRLEYSATEGKGWFLLFRPNEDDYGQDFSRITVSYDDEKVSSQDAQKSDRFIDIRPVNDAPVIFRGSARISAGNNGNGNAAAVTPNTEVGLGLRFADVDAVVSDGEEFAKMWFQLRVSEFSPNNGKLEARDVFSYSVEKSSDTDSVQYEIEQPQSNSVLGLIRWNGSVSQSNAFVRRVKVAFKNTGLYVLEVVAADNGFQGYCPPDVELDQTVYPEGDIRNEKQAGPEGLWKGTPGFEDASCNRVSTATIEVSVRTSALVVGGIAAGAGAGLLALLALGAILAAKLKQPKDLDAWQALDNAEFANAQQSGIHQGAKVGGSSAVYQGK
jgi:hypothetical protein